MKFGVKHRADLTQKSPAGLSFAGMMLLLLTRAGLLMLFLFSRAGVWAEITHRINRKDIFSSHSSLVVGKSLF